MRFSVIIPTYSRLRALRQCLAALRAQDFPAAGYEVIVVDDASPSPVSPLAPELETGLTLTLLHTPHNQGPAAARNLGAQHARGHWLAFTDDDCIPAPDWLSSLRRTLDSHPGCAVGGRILNGRPHELGAAASQAILDAVYRYSNRDPSHARFFATPNFAVSAKVFRQVGGFRPEFRTSEDREFCARLGKHGTRLFYAPDAVVVHHATARFLDFWKRHYHYGRGAYRFRRLQAAEVEERIRLEPASFYWRLLGEPFRQGMGLRPLLVSAWIAISQLASLAGFLNEWHRSR
ncbi:MAG: glycosyltransferase [Acidobacteriota bacterium]